ncbi:hypothetical protein ACWEKT_11905 [Nocardia takedensis]
MTTPQNRPVTARGAPRSTLWRGILGSAPVLSSAITLELGRNLVVNSFGDTEVVKTLAGTLRIFSVLLVAGGLVFAGYRWLGRRRDDERLADRLELLEDLEDLGPEVAGVPPRPAPAEPDRLPMNSVEAAILRDLPLREYDNATLLVVLAAIADAPDHLPATTARRRFRTATALRDHLVSLGVLVPVDAWGYRLAKVPLVASDPAATSGVALMRADPAWAAALCALLRRYADRASAWAVASDHLDHALSARRWFSTTEPMLRAVIRGCAGTPAARRTVPASSLPDLVRILDALEVWYVGSAAEPPAEFRVLCDLVCRIPRMRRFPLHHDLLAVRAGHDLRVGPRPRLLPRRLHRFLVRRRLIRPRSTRSWRFRPRRFRPRQWSTSITARWVHDRAQRDLRGRWPLPDAAAPRLERVWWTQPRADVSAEVCTLINLAVVELRRGRLEAAEDRLDLVFSRTERGRDPGGRVHAHEITGVLCWMRGDCAPALRSWLTALNGYRALGDERGTGRCLRHLGSALLLAPEYGGVVLEPDANDPLNRVEVWRQAAGWLAAADTMNPLESGSEVAGEDYAGRVRALLNPPILPPTGIDRWPAALEDPHLRAPSVTERTS